ncbi:MAG: zinc ribbon domain-containing protein, partial [Candidatus Thermoplasmatota archaeon]|nr:zinc ribbon domain-containing protein [Candidatus Thermoplasmatota archaeon]
FTVIITTNISAIPEDVILETNNSKKNMEPMVDITSNAEWKDGILHYCRITFDNPGSHDIRISMVFENETTITSNIFTIKVLESEEEKNNDTIFGFPKVYCGLSVIFLTFILILITWSYFKGRNIQKENVATTGAIKMTCSSCGSPVGPMDDICPKCNSRLDDEEHICGKCGSSISSDEVRCPKCKTLLKPVKRIDAGLKDPDIKKLNDVLDRKGKITCKKCGAVYLKNEGKCPECGSK